MEAKRIYTLERLTIDAIRRHGFEFLASCVTGCQDGTLSQIKMHDLEDDALTTTAGSSTDMTTDLLSLESLSKTGTATPTLDSTTSFLPRNVCGSGGASEDKGLGVSISEAGRTAVQPSLLNSGSGALGDVRERRGRFQRLRSQSFAETARHETRDPSRVRHAQFFQRLESGTDLIKSVAPGCLDRCEGQLRHLSLGALLTIRLRQPDMKSIPESLEKHAQFISEIEHTIQAKLTEVLLTMWKAEENERKRNGVQHNSGSLAESHTSLWEVLLEVSGLTPLANKLYQSGAILAARRTLGQEVLLTLGIARGLSKAAPSLNATDAWWRFVLPIPAELIPADPSAGYSRNSADTLEASTVCPAASSAHVGVPRGARAAADAAVPRRHNREQLPRPPPVPTSTPTRGREVTSAFKPERKRCEGVDNLGYFPKEGSAGELETKASGRGIASTQGKTAKIYLAAGSRSISIVFFLLSESRTRYPLPSQPPPTATSQRQAKARISLEHARSHSVDVMSRELLKSGTRLVDVFIKLPELIMTPVRPPNSILYIFQPTDWVRYHTLGRDTRIGCYTSSGAQLSYNIFSVPPGFGLDQFFRPSDAVRAVRRELETALRTRAISVCSSRTGISGEGGETQCTDRVGLPSPGGVKGLTLSPSAQRAVSVAVPSWVRIAEAKQQKNRYEFLRQDPNFVDTSLRQPTTATPKASLGSRGQLPSDSTLISSSSLKRFSSTSARLGVAPATQRTAEAESKLNAVSHCVNVPDKAVGSEGSKRDLPVSLMRLHIPSKGGVTSQNIVLDRKSSPKLRIPEQKRPSKPADIRSNFALLSEHAQGGVSSSSRSRTQKSGGGDLPAPSATLYTGGNEASEERSTLADGGVQGARVNTNTPVRRLTRKDLSTTRSQEVPLDRNRRGNSTPSLQSLTPARSRMPQHLSRPTTPTKTSGTSTEGLKRLKNVHSGDWGMFPTSKTTAVEHDFGKELECNAAPLTPCAPRRSFADPTTLSALRAAQVGSGTLRGRSPKSSSKLSKVPTTPTSTRISTASPFPITSATRQGRAPVSRQLLASGQSSRQLGGATESGDPERLMPGSAARRRCRSQRGLIEKNLKATSTVSGENCSTLTSSEPHRNWSSSQSVDQKSPQPPDQKSSQPPDQKSSQPPDQKSSQSLEQQFFHRNGQKSSTARGLEKSPAQPCHPFPRERAKSRMEHSRSLKSSHLVSFPVVQKGETTNAEFSNTLPIDATREHLTLVGALPSSQDGYCGYPAQDSPSHVMNGGTKGRCNQLMHRLSLFNSTRGSMSLTVLEQNSLDDDGGGADSDGNSSDPKSVTIGTADCHARVQAGREIPAVVTRSEWQGGSDATEAASRIAFGGSGNHFSGYVASGIKNLQFSDRRTALLSTANPSADASSPTSHQGGCVERQATHKTCVSTAYHRFASQSTGNYSAPANGQAGKKKRSTTPDKKSYKLETTVNSQPLNKENVPKSSHESTIGCVGNEKEETPYLQPPVVTHRYPTRWATGARLFMHNVLSSHTNGSILPSGSYNRTGSKKA